jgi:hypothetical protein
MYFWIADDVKMNDAPLFAAGKGKEAELLETAIASIRSAVWKFLYTLICILSSAV